MIEYLEHCIVDLARFQHDALLVALAVELNRIDAWRPVLRPRARPDVVHDINSFGFLTGLGEQPEPGRRAFLLLSPEKRVRADQLAVESCKDVVAGPQEHIGL